VVRVVNFISGGSRGLVVRICTDTRSEDAIQTAARKKVVCIQTRHYTANNKVNSRHIVYCILTIRSYTPALYVSDINVKQFSPMLNMICILLMMA
jgi:hypothetical protein